MNKKKRPFLVNVAILSLITVAVWIVFSVIRVYKKPTPINVPPELLEPVIPTLDLETLNNLQGKYYFSEFDNVVTNITPPEENTEEEEIIIEEETGGTGSEEELENATESGNL